MGVQLLCVSYQDKMQTVRANFCVSVILLIISQISLIQAQGDCERGQVCKKLRECDEAAELLTEAETTFDDDRKNHIINLLRNRVCGRRTEMPIGGAPESSISAESSDNGLRKLGSFRNIFHDIGGDAYAVDESTILIKGFTYDGEGPDTFFLAGKSGKPSSRGEYVLPWPANGQVQTKIICQFSISRRGLIFIFRDNSPRTNLYTRTKGENVGAVVLTFCDIY